ncbi:MAG: phosphate acyltransferase PlsX [Christensenellales bacterium]|jgi:glycerol-3-phosphate acyltransferase PlsX
MRIALDAMGGDNAPGEIIQGGLLALQAYPQIQLTLLGPEQTLREALSGKAYDAARLTVVDAPEVITTHEKPVMAIRKKRNSSLVVGMSMLKARQVDAFISAGSTGAVLAGGLFVTGRIPGISRPALAMVYPSLKGPAMVIDIGANVDCKPQHLVQFAVMGSAYMKQVLGKDNPRVGLINNGAEAEKGNELTKATYQALEQAPVNFTGNVEPREIMEGPADVLVCDGFAGNIVLKLMEGMVGAIFTLLKGVFYKNLGTKLAAATLKGGLKEMKTQMDYTEYGGAPLLGVNGCVIKAHGSSKAKAICSAVKQAIAYLDKDVTGLIADEVAKIDWEGKEA